MTHLRYVARGFRLYWSVLVITLALAAFVFVTLYVASQFVGMVGAFVLAFGGLMVFMFYLAGRIDA